AITPAASRTDADGPTVAVSCAPTIALTDFMARSGSPGLTLDARRLRARERRPRERADDRTRELGEVAVVHADRVGVRAGVEEHLALADQAPIDEDSLLIERAERRHRPGLAVAIRLLELPLVREAHHHGARQPEQRLDIHHAVRRHHGENQLLVGGADHDLRPR